MSGGGFLLGGGYPWRSLAIDHDGEVPRVVVNARRGLSLAPLREGASGLESADESLGGLTLPRGVAAGGGQLFTLSTRGDLVYRYDSVQVAMRPLAEVGIDGLRGEPTAAELDEPRRFSGAANIALFGTWLYVADRRAHRVQVFDVDSLELVRVHPVLDPADVTAGPDGVYILDRISGKVLRDHPGLAVPDVVIDVPYRAQRWDRLAVDRDGGISVRDVAADPPLLDVFERPACDTPLRSRRVTSPDEIRDRFDIPPVRSGLHGRLVVDETLLDPCGLRRPLAPSESAWTMGSLRYVLDREARTIRAHFLDGRKRHRFGPFDADGRLVPADELTAWRPVDVAGIDGSIFVFDERHQIVYSHRADAGLLKRVFKRPDDHPRRWSRMAADRDGCLLLWDGADVVDRADGSGRLVGTIAAARVAAAFRRKEDPLRAIVPPIVTRDGLVEPARRAEWPELSFHRAGIWVSEWLDSGIYNCQWDRVVLTFDSLPPGSSAILRTRTAAKAAVNPGDIDLVSAIGPAASWQTGATVSADPQPPVPPVPLDPAEFLVQSRPGQFLQLQIELSGNGLTTPIVHDARLTAPRESWLQYLPATFSQPDDQRDFLERYLAITESTWSRLETELASFDRFLDPRSVPADQLAYLAGWLDLTLEGTLTPNANRQILAALPRLWRIWGTVNGVRMWVQVHLAAFTGLPLADIDNAGVPGIIEAFVERRQLWLNRGDSATLGPTEALWSPAVERRFQVGVFDRLNDVELVSAGDPDLDVFRRHAHRFRVYVPAGWVRTSQAEAVLRRAIDLQRPAHVTFELVLVEPRFRIGDQSTVALDTVVGGAPSWALECTNETGDAPRGSDRLGYDTVVRGGRRTGSGPGTVLFSGGIS